jgi:hypothetical protein
MAQERNHSELLGRIAGEGGDYYIGTQAVSDKKFRVIKFVESAGLAGVQIGGVDVKASKNYPDTIPGGYIMTPAGDTYINHIELSSGWAEGWLVSEPDEE